MAEFLHWQECRYLEHAMIPSFTIDISNPDDIFLKNIRVNPLVSDSEEQNDSYELIAENNGKMFGIISINESEEGFLFSGDDYLSNSELKKVYGKIIEKYNLNREDSNTPPFTVESFNKVMMPPYTIITKYQLPELPGEEKNVE